MAPDLQGRVAQLEDQLAVMQAQVSLRTRISGKQNPILISCRRSRNLNLLPR
jgi:hypothetical protein